MPRLLSGTHLHTNEGLHSQTSSSWKERTCKRGKMTRIKRVLLSTTDERCLLSIYADQGFRMRDRKCRGKNPLWFITRLKFNLLPWLRILQAFFFHVGLLVLLRCADICAHLRSHPLIVQPILVSHLLNTSNSTRLYLHVQTISK